MVAAGEGGALNAASLGKQSGTSATLIGAEAVGNPALSTERRVKRVR